MILRDETTRQRVIDFLMGLSLEKVWDVSVVPYKAIRNNEQNKRYWAIITQIAEQARDEDGRQYSKEVWHEHFKRDLIGVIDLPGGGVTGMSTAKENTKEFAEYMEQVEAHAASELGVMFEHYEHG